MYLSGREKTKHSVTMLGDQRKFTGISYILNQVLGKGCGELRVRVPHSHTC